MSESRPRRAGPDDLEVLLELHGEFCAADAHRFDAARATAALVPLLAGDDRGVVWIVDGPGAYAVVTWGWSVEAGGPEAVLDEIYAARRGEGVGSALMTHLVADCRDRGFRRIFLETEVPNEPARALYARHGFRSDDSIWMSLDLVPLD